jgi:hypothetical protein
MRFRQRCYRWRLSVHLLPFFGAYPLDEIDRRLCLRFKEAKLREAEELRRAIAAGAVLRDRRGRRITPLGLASIKKLIETLGSILDEAIEDEHIERNPARGSRTRIRAPKPARTFLEMDELVALIDAAGDEDGPLTPALNASTERLDGTRAEVARAIGHGMRPRDVARTLGLAKATVGYHLARLGAELPPEYAILKSFAELERTPGVPGLDLPGLDAVSIAKGYGCDAARVTSVDALVRAAAGAWSKDVPTILEVPIAPETPRLV